MRTSAFVLADDIEQAELDAERAVLRELTRGPDRGSDATAVGPTVLTPERVTLDRWLAAERWFEFSRAGDAPADWLTGESDARCGNCGASASSLCSMACPERFFTTTHRHPLAVQVPCESHRDESTADGDGCPSCIDGLVTAAWATIEFGPLHVVDYRYRLRRSKPNQFKLSDGSYHDAPPDIEPICLPGRWARGGSIEVTNMTSRSPARGARATASARAAGTIPPHGSAA